MRYMLIGEDHQGLTPREIEVLRLIACGSTYTRVAAQLEISAHTVATHIKSIYRKLEVHSGAAAVMRAVDLQLLAPRMAPPGTPIQ